MATYTAIAEASETLIELLRDRIAERSDVVSIDRNEIALVSPDDVGADSDIRLSMFLYDVSENTVLKNQEARMTDPDKTRDPPLALDLRYLLTAFPSQTGSEATTNTLDQQRVLGLAMQVLNDNSILGADELPASLADTELQVTLEEETVQTVTDVWGTFPDTPLQPSVTYQISPVLIDAAERDSVDRVSEKGTDYQRKDER